MIILKFVLCANGFLAWPIHGDKNQGDREEALRAFKRGAIMVMVSTGSVAFRVLDILNVTLVINHDFPTNIDN